MNRFSLRPLLAAGMVATVAFAVYLRRDDLASFDWSIDPAALVGAVALLAVPGLVQAATFVVALRRVGGHGPWREALKVWARSWLLRYEPSGAVGFAYRVSARERLGATTPQVLTATAYEQLAAMAGGALAAPIGFAVAGLAPPAVAVVAAGGAALLLVALRPAWLGGWARRRLEARGIEAAAPLRGRTVAALVAVHAAGWTATALGLGLVADGVGAGGAPVGVLLGAAALSWLAGVLVPLAPGGLGVRDAALAIGVAPALGAAAATSLTVALRVLGFAGEVLAYVVVEAAALLPRRPRPSPAPRTVAASPADTRGVIVVVPTFNEAEALPLFVERFAATGLELLVVDDSSPDRTGALADELAAERPWMHVLHRAGKDGLGVAYRAGFTWCLERGYRAVGQMDCDLSHPPEKLAEMLQVLDTKNADLIIGNRYLPGGGTANWSKSRVLLSRVGCTASRLLLGLPYDDLSGGFKLWRASCLRDLDLDTMLAAGYAFQIETTQVAHLLGKQIEEIPFTFHERIAGESKMSLSISLEGVGVLLRLRASERRRSRLAQHSH
jgi:dolichol-phosphate mannosyltransferase